MQLSAPTPKTEPSRLLQQYFDRLLRELGPQGWWPARTRFEVILGAILTQNTSWQNAAQAIKNLRKAGLIRPTRLNGLVRAELESLIRPAGFYRQKARSIRNFLEWLDKACRASLSVMFNLPASELRRKLLKIPGLGPETADAILLYAGRQPFFVADAYTRRILERHELVSPGVGYAEVQEFLHRSLSRNHRYFNEYHALLVEVGKRHCKRSAPLCAGCPLEVFLPLSKRVGNSREIKANPPHETGRGFSGLQPGAASDTDSLASPSNL
jgi:endonuclease III related protein